ncbi:MAG TPA: hypothetical protein PLK34_02465 [Candidatus Pacearchaeota archaeon]|nr:hypothetical protein [Candidatus Pacearchaeota archaeon]
MSYDSRKLELLANRFIKGDIKRESLEKMISKTACEGTDYIISPPKSPKINNKNYRIENQGDRLVRLNKHGKIVAVLEYYFDSSGVLYLPWGESYEKGNGHMGALFSEAKNLAKGRGVKEIMFEVDETNEIMQEIAYHWKFERGDRVHNSNNTESYFYYLHLK